MVNVKICGLTSLDDALFALEFGADYVGFIVDVPVETPRKITLQQAAGIVQEIERDSVIIVLMPSTLKEIEGALELKPFGLQLHGNETLEFMKQVREISSNTKLIKTIHVKKDSTLAEIEKQAESYSEVVDYLLLDTQTGKIGGTGVTHDWNLARKLTETVDRPMFLSGGLNPENVCDAIKTARPFAVDVASGVESRPGVKDRLKVKRFIVEAGRCSI